jgi:hypothetical protein
MSDGLLVLRVGGEIDGLMNDERENIVSRCS